MENKGFLHLVGSMCFCIIFLSQHGRASIRRFGQINPPFQGAQMNWIDNDGIILLSNDSNFGFGFVTTAQDVTLFLLVVMHMATTTTIWTANRGSPVQNSDNFVFGEDGNAYLDNSGTVVWSSNTANKGVTAMVLEDSGNLVFLGNDSKPVWQSFDLPTDTLILDQDFKVGMKLVSNPNSKNVSYFLEIDSGDMMLYAGFVTPQPYWSAAKDNRKIINKNDGEVAVASLADNSWRFYDQENVLLYQFVFPESNDPNATRIAVLGDDGFITFWSLQSYGQSSPSSTKIPSDSCSTPEPCDPYYVCYSGNKCQCPDALNSRNCKPGIVSPCSVSKDSMELIGAGNGLSYFALDFASPSSKTDLNGCISSCNGNCSCLALFFENSTGHCFMFDSIGSFQNSDGSGFVTYIKVLTNGPSNGTSGSSSKHFPIVVLIIVGTIFIILALLCVALRYYRKRGRKMLESPQETSEEDNFLEGLSGMPVRFSYRDLQIATNNFSVKLGQGGFGSVYQGVLQDGTRLAVKKLEGIGQGKKEFRAEVSIIGSIHHIHLVRLKGFCAEGSHRLLAYEYMANGSLDKWIFRKSKEEFSLDWETRFNIALGTAKGLAYLHEDCDVKIVHCDIKPENVLLDDNFQAKVSDFGLAKLMTREQSHVFTTLRGTRGYLAPEWITNYAISEKSDVYSYGMVLLEIIGGRKNYDPIETSEKSHFPTYAYKMMEEGKLRDILDSKLEVDEIDERVATAIKVALLCIQDDMHTRPSMTKIVQMLEGVCSVPNLPTSSQMGSRLFSNVFKSISDEGTSSGPSDCNSDAYLSAVRLSGPR